MGKWKGMTTEELQVLREIERINFQIRSAAKEFGMNSRLYHQYENMLFPRSGLGLGSGRMHRHMESGVVQLRTDKGAIRQYVLGSYRKDLKQLGRMETVGEVKKHMVSAYAQRKRIDESTMKRADRKEALEAEKKYDQGLFDKVSQFLDIYYKLENEVLPMGGEFASHEQLRQISKGHWSSYDELNQMLTTITTELEAEHHIAVKNFIEGL